MEFLKSKYLLFISSFILLFGALGLVVSNINMQYLDFGIEQYIFIYPVWKIFIFSIFIFPIVNEIIFRGWINNKLYCKIIGVLGICTLSFLFLDLILGIILSVITLSLFFIVKHNKISQITLVLLSSLIFSRIYTFDFSYGWWFYFIMNFGFSLLMFYIASKYNLYASIVSHATYIFIIFLLKGLIFIGNEEPITIRTKNLSGQIKRSSFFDNKNYGNQYIKTCSGGSIFLYNLSYSSIVGRLVENDIKDDFTIIVPQVKYGHYSIKLQVKNPTSTSTCSIALYGRVLDSIMTKNIVELDTIYRMCKQYKIVHVGELRPSYGDEVSDPNSSMMPIFLFAQEIRNKFYVNVKFEAELGEIYIKYPLKVLSDFEDMRKILKERFGLDLVENGDKNMRFIYIKEKI